MVPDHGHKVNAHYVSTHTEGLLIFRTANPLGFCLEERVSVSKNRRSFTPEFKEEAAKMVVEATRPVASVARELQLNEQTLRNWVNEYRRTHAADEPPLTVSERARLLCRAGRLSLSVRLTCVPACRSTVTARPSITPEA